MEKLKVKFSSNPTIQKLLSVSNEISDINGAIALLGWDQETYMPSKAFEVRAKQLATLTGIAHTKLVDKSNGVLIKKLEGAIKNAPKKFSVYDKAFLREFKRAYNMETKLPLNFVKELTEQTSLALEKWKEAKGKADFSIFEPKLTKLIDLLIKKTKYLGYKESPYDALLDIYEPFLTEKKVEETFKPLKEFTVKFLKDVKESGVVVDDSILHRGFDADKQFGFSFAVIKALGYDLEAGRQDKSSHPFTTDIGSPRDIRITTRVLEDELQAAIMASIHEAGHALYEQGISYDLVRTPLTGGTSLGIHESQSRMWENFVGRSAGFWDFWFGKLADVFPEKLKRGEKEVFVRALNKVKPSFIRVEADEVTYNLHVILRFEIERALIKKEIKVADLPRVWNEKMKEYFGIVPSNDAKGVLQDIHWSMGLFGYFPTYTLGNIYAAQFWNKILKDIPGIEAEIRAGKFELLLIWLRENIHQYGKIYPAGELCIRITGESLNSKYLIDYLKGKFGGIYGL